MKNSVDRGESLSPIRCSNFMTMIRGKCTKRNIHQIIKKLPIGSFLIDNYFVSSSSSRSRTMLIDVTASSSRSFVSMTP